MRKRILFAIFAASVLAAPAHAQLGLLGTSESVSIALSPAHPGPHDAVRLTVQSSLSDVARSSIVWRANGKIIAQGTGVTSATITAGDLGAETTIDVATLAPDGTAAAATAHVIPTEVDLLFDSDSYTPPFYRGRALPSAGTSVVLQAIPHFIRPGGSRLALGDLVYTWKKNDQVLGDLSGRGKSAIVIPAPVLYATDVLSVDVESSDGLLSGESSVAIHAEDPMIVLYENHPIFGVLYGSALSRSASIAESEMTFTAVPYFASVRNPTDRQLQYVWRINGTKIPTDTNKPNELTLKASASSNIAHIELALTHATNFFLDSSGSWNVTFSAAGGGQDLFRSTP